MKKVFILLACIMVMSFALNGFKAEQKRYPRVRKAYEEKEESVKQILTAASIKMDELEIYMRVLNILKSWNCGGNLETKPHSGF